jgi:hypothetical protein
MTYSKDGADQSNIQAASANIEQFQDATQTNISMQNAAVAVALKDSQATATQASYQANFNAQVASATAENVETGRYTARRVLDGTDVNGDSSWAVAYENGSDQANRQVANVDITQIQLIEQLNVNEQFSAIAFATCDGNASAEQVNYEVNENVQLAEGSAANASDSSESGKEEESKEEKVC